MAKTAAVIGAGHTGTAAALGLLNAGFDVTLYSDKDRAQLRDGTPATGTAIYFGTDAQDADARISPRAYADTLHSTGYSVRIYDTEGKPALAIDAPFPYAAESVDVRLRADDRLEQFLSQGGQLVIEQVTPERLDQIAAAAELTLVATGKGGLASIFPVDEERTVYTAPQRELFTITLTGDEIAEAWDYRTEHSGEYNLLNIHSANGEVFVGPYHHKDIGPSWVILAFGRPEGEWPEIFAKAQDAASALEVARELFTRYFPEDAAVVDGLRLIDSDAHSWLRGAVTPTVRRPVGQTASGGVVGAIGDVAIAYDPITGQGAQNAIIQVANLVRAAAEHTGEFDAAWFTELFDEHWRQRGYASTEVTRLFLGDPKYAVHNELGFPAASVDPRVGTALFGLLDRPNPALELRNGDDVRQFIAAVTQEDADAVLNRVEPAAFAAAEAKVKA